MSRRSGAPPERPVTLRAMLAADCSELPRELRHLIHVLALHANNVTGRGLTGQSTLARYLGCSARSVRRQLAQLDELWAAGSSPVGVLREKRWLNSDAYQIVVRADAVLALPRSGPEADERSPMAANDRSPMTAMSGHPWPVNRPPMANQAVTHDQKEGVERSPVAYKLHSGSTEPSMELTTGSQNYSGGAASAGASARLVGETTEPAEPPQEPELQPEGLTATQRAARAFAARKAAAAAAAARGAK